jgi:hypothetical protein
MMMTDERKVQIVECDGITVERQEYTGDIPPPVELPAWKLSGGLIVIHSEAVTGASGACDRASPSCAGSSGCPRRL